MVSPASTAYAQTPEGREYLLIGAGQMGEAYLRNLIELGISPAQISVVDVDLSKAEALQLQYPEISIGNTLPKEKPKKTFVLSSTPAHLKNLEDLSELTGPDQSVLVEKPFVTVAQHLEGRAHKVLEAFSTGVVAYLIEFSPALQALSTFMEEHPEKLTVIHGRGNWFKNRIGNSRPSAGDLEDEMTHQLGALMLLAKTNQQLNTAGISARMQSLRFTDPSAQAALVEGDGSVSLNPNSATSMTVELTSNRSEIPIMLSLFSSFTLSEQERVIEVVLSDGSADPWYGATLRFDDGGVGSDSLRIRDLRSKEIVYEKVFSKADKLRKQIEAFLHAAQAGERHPALRSFRDGDRLVALAAAAIASHKAEGRIIEVDMSL
ncbi:MAG: NAD(P)-binding domain-containing protein [Bdellovibrionales bacterium]|nr:NAD(P)-binding domain-containing protein [Bdellovibrionales bacterium]